jgi:ABC-2 type transport system ATP-binding protein
MLTTILPQTSGIARVFGHDVRRRADQVRRLIGYVPQALSADGDLTGYENLLVFAKLLGIPRSSRREKINAVLQKMGLEEAADRRLRYYSGGMVRRLEIGQAMLIQPRLLFLDEPTIGLDPVARGTVWELLDSFRREESLTILLTTHYMEEAEALCDRVAIMNHGQLAAVGTPDELKAASGKEGATLEDAFRFFTGGDYEKEGNFRELKRTRKLARRLG